MPVDMLYLLGMTPRYPGHINAKRLSKPLTLLGTGRVAPLNNRLEHLAIEARRFQQVLQAEVPFRHPVGYAPGPLHDGLLHREIVNSSSQSNHIRG
jgi:hypothetical protein